MDNHTTPSQTLFQHSFYLLRSQKLILVIDPNGGHFLQSTISWENSSREILFIRGGGVSRTGGVQEVLTLLGMSLTLLPYFQYILVYKILLSAGGGVGEDG